MDPAAKAALHAIEMADLAKARDMAQSAVNLYGAIFGSVSQHPVLGELDAEIRKDIASTVFIQVVRRNGR